MLHQHPSDLSPAGAAVIHGVDDQQVDAGVQRILAASTGSFRDEFDQRADGFKEAARKARGTPARPGLRRGAPGSIMAAVATAVARIDREEPPSAPTLGHYARAELALGEGTPEWRAWVARVAS